MKTKVYSKYNFINISKQYALLAFFFYIPATTLQAFQNANLVHNILINGVSTDIINNRISLKTSDNISIVLPRISDTLNYKYQCEGRDSFYEIDSFPIIHYNNFSTGSFSFRVNTSIRSDEEISNQTPLIIEVHHSFLDSWNFTQSLLVYIFLLFGGAGYFILLSNYRNKLKLLDLRNDWTNKLHNDIGADLSSVALHINVLNRRLGKMDPAQKEKIGKILTILNTIQNKLRFVFDLVDPKKNSLQVMLSEIELFANENFALQEINFNFENKLDKTKNRELNIGQINKVYLIIKEAINNAVKHSSATNASIKITEVKEGISISIKDDGKGFDCTKKQEGNGIDNLLQYGREGFIDIQINSFPNKGTEVKMLIPKL